MAAFRIHQDSEKENTVHAPIDKSRNNQVLKDKRTTFAELNNIPQKNQNATGKAAFRDIKAAKGGKATIEVLENVKPMQRKPGTNIPTEPFKFFSVYEDQTSGKTQADLKLKDCNAQAKALKCAIRNPLKDIQLREGLPSTPISVSDAPSPMSVDRVPEVDVPTIKPEPPRNDRERFFEVDEYQTNILEYLRSSENKFRPKPDYMKRQPDINYSMRAILVDWLVEVSEEYRLHTETLCLAISYIDRFLSIMSVVRAKLQLVGTAAMFLAAKYEEIYPPDVGEFVFITDDTYTKSQVLKMEQIILKTLQFELCAPTHLVFINTYFVLHKMPDQVKHLSTYISELSLLSGDPFLQFLPSKISAAAVALARYNLDLPMWCLELEEITTYSLNELKHIILFLHRSHKDASSIKQQAIQEKYKNNKYMEVSTIKPVELDETTFHRILMAYNRTKLLSATEVIGNDQTAAANENVRKMISSLMFV